MGIDKRGQGELLSAGSLLSDMMYAEKGLRGPKGEYDDVW
jgi:hypothetical protein